MRQSDVLHLTRWAIKPTPMPLSDNSQLLVQALESMTLLDGRFENIRLVNFNSFTDVKRGCFSLVFSAHDIIEDTPVALKFYDLDPLVANDDYRRAAFRREHEILQVVLNKERCLQLASALSAYNLVIPISPLMSVTIPCEYFAVEWVGSDIDDYFFQQEKFDALDKLYLFNEITLAVEALHRYEVFHRDLKPDNLRRYQEAIKRIVIAIDLGTAARFSSARLQPHYGHTAGAPAYSAPEAICGLAGNRVLAPYTDCYALGCLLFELFNRDYFYKALFTKNPRYQVIYTAMKAYLSGITDETDQVRAWKSALAKYSAGVEHVCIDGPGTTVPPGIATLLNETLRSLTHVDYSNRPIVLSKVRVRIWAAIRTLQNEKLNQRRIAMAKEIRRRRIEKQQRRADVLNRVILAKHNYAN